MATSTGEAPEVLVVAASSTALAIGVDNTYVFEPMPFAGTVTAAQYITISAITGADTNSRTVAVVNKGTAGSGSTAVASLPLTAAVNTVAFVPKTITLSGTAANLDFAQGDVLVATSTHVGNGIADPGGKFLLTISRA